MRINAICGSILLAVSGLGAATPAFADDLVTNGNFSAGNTGFTSHYIYNVDAFSNPPGSYFILSDGDHTTGTGNYLLADSNGATPSDYFWSETFAVKAGSSYAFTAYVRSNSTTNEPYFVAQANGSTIASLNGVGPDGYVAVTGSFASGSATSVTLQLFNYDPVYSYNDLRVDDISFVGAAAGTAGSVPEPASWALMMGGLGAAGTVLRRRRSIGARTALA